MRSLALICIFRCQNALLCSFFLVAVWTLDRPIEILLSEKAVFGLELNLGLFDIASRFWKVIKTSNGGVFWTSLIYMLRLYYHNQLFGILLPNSELRLAHSSARIYNLSMLHYLGFTWNTANLRRLSWRYEAAPSFSWFLTLAEFHSKSLAKTPALAWLSAYCHNHAPAGPFVVYSDPWPPNLLKQLHFSTWRVSQLR